MPKIIFSQDYNRHEYQPPMPVLRIGLSRAGRSQPTVYVEALVDTGSDASMMPLELLEQANAQSIDRAMIRGITGHRQSVELYLATIHIGSYRVHAVQVAAIENAQVAILGRDVLNHLNVMLSGTAGVTDLFE